VLWNSQIRTGDAGFGVKAGQFGFNVTGKSGLSFVVEATTNLGQPVWTPLSTNTLSDSAASFDWSQLVGGAALGNTNTISDGAALFSDPQWQGHPTRFYRITTP
jgi:hypothetical protein